MAQYFIGIDSGTSGIKAVLFAEDGTLIDKEAFPLTGIFPQENMYEEDPLEVWEKGKLAIKTVAERNPDRPVAGIGITAQGDGLWMFDENMDPVRNGACFCDGRAGDIVDRWVADGTCEKLFDLTGTRLFSGNQNGIVKWMEENEPENLERAAHLLHLKDYLFYRLTGKITTDATDQSLVFLDQNTRDYLPEAFEVCGLTKYRDKYAPILPAKENAFPILPELAAQMGLTDQVLVTSGPMDVSACALGSGVVEKGECCSIMGTAALHEQVLDKPLQDHILAGMTVTHVMEDRWLRLMASLAGTPNLEWMLDTLGGQIKTDAAASGRNVYAYMEDMIRDVPIGANGILYHPYLLAGGERAPFTDPRARASYTGISVRHTLGDIVRATYEGVAYAMLDCYQNMPQEITRLTVCGGGANSEMWCRMFADAVGTQIVTVKGDELGAKGVVLNNMVIQGLYSSYKDAVDQTVETDKIFEPDMKKHERYMEIYELYRMTYQQIRPTWKLRGKLIKEET